ncbi:MAG: hypothetical protein JWO31_3030, partial [Phycisphaerales bacterium]|nr:hypothetical protein [Phycisphaerales bacterium]
APTPAPATAAAPGPESAGLLPGESVRDGARRLTAGLLKQGVPYRQAWADANRRLSHAMFGGAAAPVAARMDPPAGPAMRVPPAPLPGTRLTLWQHPTTGAKRVYVGHPDLALTKAWVEADPQTGHLYARSNDERTMGLDATGVSRVVAPLLAHGTMDELARIAKPGRSVAEAARDVSDYADRQGERPDAAAARRLAMVKKENPHLSDAAAGVLARSRSLRAGREAYRAYVARQAAENPGLGFSRAPAAGDDDAGAGSFAFSRTDDGGYGVQLTCSRAAGRETPALGHGRPGVIDGQPVTYRWKPMISAGTYHHPNPRVGRGGAFTLSRSDIVAADKHTRDWMRNEGGRPYVPTKHKGFDARDNMGWLVDTRVDGDTLWGLHQFIGEDAARVAARNETSVKLRRNFTSGRGVTYPWIVEHNALCPDPVIEGLGDFVPAALAA